MKRPKAGTVCQAGISPNTLIAHLQKIASPAAFLQEPNPPLASVNNLSILEELKCAICANVLSQPLELMCSALVCTTCILTESIAASGAVSCTCCSNDGPLLPTHVRPASNAILLLLSDVRRHGADCNRDIRSGDYEGHECVPSLTPEEEKQAAELRKRAISTSPDKANDILQVTKAKQQTTSACSRTTKMRYSEMQRIRSIASGGEASALIQKEVLTLSDEERQCLLATAGISSSIEIGPAQVLAIKAGLAIPWNKLRLLRRWLKSSGIHLAGEERMRHISSHIVGNNLNGEVAPFTFPLPSGGDEIKGAPLVYIPHLVDKSTIRGDYEFLSKMYGLSGASVIRWLHLYPFEAMPRKGHLRVCPPGLHIMLGIFTKLFHMLEAVCSQLDLELANHTTDVNSSSFFKYSQALQRLLLLQVYLENAKHAQEVLQQVATYVALVNGEKKTLAVDLLKQSTEKKKSVKALEAKVAKCIAAVERGYPEKKGPFVKILDNALQSFGVQRQQYFSGAFIGNHVHKAIQAPNIQTMCTSILQLVQEKLPHLSGKVAGQVANFRTTFSLYSKCHGICEHNYIDEAQAHALDQAIEPFFYRNTYPEATVPLKMHLLEDHAVQWANTYHVGFGLLGEQGAE
eukprot:Em0030g18a